MKKKVWSENPTKAKETQPILNHSQSHASELVNLSNNMKKYFVSFTIPNAIDVFSTLEIMGVLLKTQGKVVL